MFNPIPTDAPEFFSSKAHYIDCENKVSSRGANREREKTTSRYFIFSIGRSVKNYVLRDKYMDDNALELLEQTRPDNKRLVIKGYNSPSGFTMFVVLTHFGIYVNSNPGFRVINPETGEFGYYKLETA